MSRTIFRAGAHPSSPWSRLARVTEVTRYVVSSLAGRGSRALGRPWRISTPERLKDVSAPEGRHSVAWGVSPGRGVRSGRWALCLLALLWPASLQAQFTPSCTANIAVFDDSSYVDTTSGGVDAESDNVQATLSTSLGHNVSTFTGITAADWTTGVSGQDILVIPEQEVDAIGPALDLAAITAIRSFVDGGGGLVIFGRSSVASEFLNTVFGFATSESFIFTSSTLDAVAALGTSFAGGPATLPHPSATTQLLGLPLGASTIYTPAVVVRLTSGTGRIVYLGWDWFDAVPNGVQDGGWVEVLDRAVDEVGCRGADLALTKSDSVDPVFAGNPLTYTLTVTNNGPADATGVTITDTLPGGVSFVSASAGCSEAAGVVTCSIGNLANGASAMVTINVTVSNSAVGTLVNNADASADQDDPSSNATAENTTVMASAVLTVDKTGDPAAVAGQPLDYLITLTNTGPSDAAGIAVSDVFPPQLTGVVWACLPSGSATCAANGTGNLSDTVSIPAGDQVVYSIDTNVLPSATGSSITNTVNVTNPIGANVSDSHITPLSQQATLSVTKTGDTTATAGGPIAYSITLSNSGPSDVTGVGVSDAFPATLTGVSWTCVGSGGGSCSGGSGAISDSVNLPVGASVTYTINGTVLSDTAAGPLTNTVMVSNPAGTDVSDDHTTTIDRQATVTASKTGPASAAPGEAIQYTLTIGNTGPSDASGIGVDDTFPAELTTITWTCATSGGASCTASGNTTLSDTVSIPAGGQLVYTVDATVSPGAVASSITNTVMVTNPIGSDVSDSQVTSLAPNAVLSLTKTGDATAVAGQSIGYTITVANAGPSDVTGATVTDTFPSALSSITWTCTPSGGATCTANGAGNLSDTVAIPAGGQLVYTVSATVDPAASGSITNTATMVNPIGANASDSQTTALSATADLSISKTGDASATAGGSLSYTIVVANAGPSDVTGTTVADAFPIGLSSISWTCTSATGATCPASGSGNLSETVSIPAGASATFSVTATVDPAAAAGTLTNTATITAPAGVTDPAGNNSSSANTTVGRQADLSITKTGSLTAVAGGSLSYTVAVANAGPSSVTGATVTDTFPAGLSNIAWSCVASNGSCPVSGSGSLSTTVDLDDGGSATFSITADVDAGATGVLTNMASVGAPAGTGDPQASNNNTSHDTTIQQQADLAMAKTGSVNATAGGPVSFTLTVTNAGPGNVTGARVVDTFPPSLSGITWTCAATLGSCPSSGAGNLDHTVDLMVGGQLVYTISATVDAGASGTLSNTATVTNPAGVSDPSPGNNSDGHNVPLDVQADLGITKTGPANAAAGGPITYTVNVTNAGPSDVSGASVNDVFPASLQSVSWTCSASGGSCPPSGNTNIAHTVSLDVGGTLTYSISATLAPDASGTLINTATVAPPAGVTDPGPTANSDQASTTVGVEADLSITKTGSGSATAGGSLSYQIVVTNGGPSDVAGATVNDTFPTELSNAVWTCVASAGSCGSGSGDLSDTIALPVGATATYSVTADVDPAATGNLLNTASVASTSDPNTGNNSNSHSTTLGAQADLSITKTGDANATAGGSLSYTVVARNLGPSAVTGATVADTLPSALSNGVWSCSGSGGASCPGAANGDLAASVDLPVGGIATFTLTADVDAAATGTLLNTATISPPLGVVDPVSGNDSDSHSTSLDGEADLDLTLSDTPDPVTAGEALTYTLTVTNAGPSDAPSTVVSLQLPSGTTLQSASGGCSESPPGTVSCSLGTLANGGNANRTVTVAVGANATGPLVANADVGSGASDPTPATVSATTTVERRADLSITKTDGRTSTVPGTPLTYTVTVRNLGPSDVTGATVADTFPIDFVVSGWTCVPTAGAVCTLSGSGDLSDTVTLPSGGMLTYTVNGTVAAGASGVLSNTASVTGPGGVTDPVVGNDSATDTTNLSGEADLSITKTDGQPTAVPGESLSYTVVASNAGPSTVATTVRDTFPTDFTAVTWSCVGSGGGICPSSGGGDLAAAVTLPAGGSTTFTITGTVDPAATANLVNTASIDVPAGVTDTAPGNETASDTDLLLPEADLAITKTDGVATVVPGDTVTYTVTVTNAGPSNVVGATVADAFPSELAPVTWTCSPAGGATCTGAGSSDLLDTVDLPAGSSVVYTATGTLADDAEGTLSNTANVTAPASVSDPNAANDTALDTDLITREADLSITKTDGVTQATPGGGVTYIITVGNAGPSAVNGATVSDPFPAVLTCQWSCTADPGASCTAGPVSGAIADSVDLPVGANVTYTAVCAIAAGASGGLSNTASVSAPDGVTDPVGANNTATDVDALGAEADLVLTKTDGVTSVAPGESLGYTLVATNTGPSDAPGSQLSDAFTAGLDCVWTCVGTGGATCTPGQVAGNIADSFDLPVAATATYTATCQLPADFPAGPLANTATLSAGGTVTDTDPNDNTASDLDTVVVPRFDLALDKSASTTNAVPGEPLAFTLTVSHVGGPSDALGAVVTDTVPTGLSAVSWTCTASAGSACTGAGTGDLLDTVTLRVGGSLTYSISATVDADATGSLVNTATVAAPAGAVDTQPSNDGDSVSVTLVPTVDLAITKTDGVTAAIPGEPLSTTVTVTNAGPSDVVGALVSDTLPAAYQGTTWTCAASAGSSCPASGSGDLAAVVDLAVGGTATFTLDTTLDPAATGFVDNVATVTAPAGVVDVDLANNLATDGTDLEPRADLSITKTDGVTTAVPGNTLDYTLVVANAGPSTVLDATVADPVSALGAGILDCTWTCVATGGGSCDPGPTVGDLLDTVDLPPLATLGYTGTCAIASDAGPLTLDNTATVAVPDGVDDPTASNDSASDATDLVPTADLVVTKDDGRNSAIPGDTLTYLITVRNPAGPSDLSGVAVDDTFPASLDCNWTCAALGNGTCNPGQVEGNLQDLVDLPVGAHLTYTAVCAIDSAATGSVVNAAILSLPAGAADPNASNNSDTDVTTLDPVADLAITKTDGVTSATPGGSVTYTIVVDHLGGSDVVGAQVEDVFPNSLDCTWTCVAEGGGSCNPGQVAGPIDDTVTLPSGSRLTYTAVCQIDPAAGGFLANTASVTAPLGIGDSNPANNSASDLDTALAPVADLAITKDDGTLSATPGETVTYTITARNLVGPSDVTGATVTDHFPADLDCTWTCALAGGASCTSGPVSGDLIDTIDLPVGASVTYTAVCQIDPGAAGTLSNTAAIAAPAGTIDPDPSNDTAVDDDTVLADRIDLSITVDDGVTTVVPGGTTTYTITVSQGVPPLFPKSILGNDGIDPAEVVAEIAIALLGLDRTEPSRGRLALDLAMTGDVPSALIAFAQRAEGKAKKTVADDDTKATVEGLLVRDLFPAALDCAWTCVADVGASCTAGPVAGDLVDSVTLAEGTEVTYTAICQIDPGAAGTLSNTASLTIPAGVLDVDPSNDSDTDVDTLFPAADLVLTKSDGTTTAIPGGSITYTLVASNPTGPSDVLGAQVVDFFAPELDCLWSCATAEGATCAPGQTVGDVQDFADLPVGGSVTYTAVCQIASTALGSLANTADLLPDPGTTEIDPSDNTASDLDTVLVPTADLVITKDDGLSQATPGESLVYTLTVSNPLGPSDLLDATVSDVFPTGLDCLWGCVGSGGATCNPGQVAGNLLDSVDLPVGAVATYTAVCQVAPDALGTLVNTATVAVPTGSFDPDPSNDSASDDDTELIPVADLAITKDDGVETAIPGGQVTYTITVANPMGPSTASALVEDLFPPTLDCTWTCVGQDGGHGSGQCASGPVSGDLVDTVTLPVGSAVVYTALCQVDPQATGALGNTATVAIVAPGIDPEPGNDNASDLDTLVPHVDLAITKTDRVAEVVPGEDVVYTLTVSNAGPSPALGALVSDTPPTGLGCSWSCVAGVGASCPAGTPGNDLAALLDLDPGASATLTGECTVDPGLTGSLVNVATVAAPAGTVELDPANDTATDSDALTPVADLAISKDDGLETVLPGGEVTYTIGVSNLGPSDAPAANVEDLFPADLDCTWTCVAEGDADCTAGPVAGDLTDMASLSASTTVTYTAVCTVDAGASGTLVNTATVSTDGVDPEPANDTASDSTLVGDEADLAITVVDDPDPVAPGGELVWVVTVSNLGPIDDPGVTVTSLLPGQVLLSDVFVGDGPPLGEIFEDGFESGDTSVWAATANTSGGSQTEGGNPCTQEGDTLSCDLGPLAAGESIDLVILADVVAGASGTLIHTVTVEGQGSDPVSSNDSAVALTTVASTLAGRSSRRGGAEPEEAALRASADPSGSSSIEDVSAPLRDRRAPAAPHASTLPERR